MFFNFCRAVVGTIDGSHAPVSAPDSGDNSMCYNSKGLHSVILLAIVDNPELFRWICAGYPGSNGDGEIFN